jgi:hypothetical protein
VNHSLNIREILSKLRATVNNGHSDLPIDLKKFGAFPSFKIPLINDESRWNVLDARGDQHSVDGNGIQCWTNSSYDKEQIDVSSHAFQGSTIGTRQSSRGGEHIRYKHLTFTLFILNPVAGHDIKRARGYRAR